MPGIKTGWIKTGEVFAPDFETREGWEPGTHIYDQIRYVGWTRPPLRSSRVPKKLLQNYNFVFSPEYEYRMIHTKRLDMTWFCRVWERHDRATEELKRLKAL